MVVVELLFRFGRNRAGGGGVDNASAVATTAATAAAAATTATAATAGAAGAARAVVDDAASAGVELKICVHRGGVHVKELLVQLCQ